MFRKFLLLQGQMRYLGQATADGSTDGLGSNSSIGAVFSEKFGTTSAEVEAAKELSEPTQAADPSASASEVDGLAEGSDEPDTEDSGQDSQANGKVTTEGPTTQELATENAKLSGKVDMLTEMNESLNSDKAKLQASLDAKQAELDKSVEANDALKPAAIRQIKTLSVALGKPTEDDLTGKSCAELGAMCSDLLAKLSAAVPSGQKASNVPSGSDGEPQEAILPTAKESGLAGL